MVILTFIWINVNALLNKLFSYDSITLWNNRIKAK